MIIFAHMLKNGKKSTKVKIQSHMEFVDRITQVIGDSSCETLCHFESDCVLLYLVKKEILKF